jgi:hypothetical protein
VINCQAATDTFTEGKRNTDFHLFVIRK